MKQGLITSLAIVIFASGIGIFLFGFFPIKSATLREISPSSKQIEPVFGRAVVILVDGMRADFVFDDNFPMVETRQHIRSGSGVPFIARADPPTVTLPRLKALISGGLPTFLDVVLNLNSQALQADSVIAALARRNRTLAMYGDDTWLKLFPTQFARSEGTSSFFVSDTTEVDNNVTRHIADELPKRADLVILHYLGVDHAGHQSGAFSPLMAGEIAEMDGIVSRVYSELQALDAADCAASPATCRPSLLVLCSDHGMTDRGNHGGGSDQERNSVLVFLSPLFRSMQPQAVSQVPQVDFAPTLSLLLGVPPPAGSVGGAILSVLQLLPVHRRIEALLLNAAQLETLAATVVHDSDARRQLHHLLSAARDAATTRDVNVAESAFAAYFREVKSVIIPALAEHNITASVTGLAVAAAAVAVLVAQLLRRRDLWSWRLTLLFTGVGLQLLSLTASSFIEEEHRIVYYFTTTVIAVALAAPALKRGDSRAIFAALAAALFIRVARSWYSGGDKFASLPGVATYLRTDTSLTYVSVVGSLFMIAIPPLLLLRSHTGVPVQVRTSAQAIVFALVLLLMRAKVSTGFKIWGFITELVAYRIILGLCAAMVVLGCSLCFLRNQRLVSAGLLCVQIGVLCATMAVHPAVHMPLFLGFTLQALVVYAASVLVSADVSAMVLLFMWCGRAAFFALGNSNSVATVDLSGAYTGLTSYQPVLVGVLTLVSLYGVPTVFALQAIVAYLRSSTRCTHFLCLCMLTVQCARLLLSATMVLAMRHHLFVWSVFAPKLAYELLETIFVVGVCVVLSAADRLAPRLFIVREKVSEGSQQTST